MAHVSMPMPNHDLDLQAKVLQITFRCCLFAQVDELMVKVETNKASADETNPVTPFTLNPKL